MEACYCRRVGDCNPRHNGEPDLDRRARRGRIHLDEGWRAKQGGEQLRCWRCADMTQDPRRGRSHNRSPPRQSLRDQRDHDPRAGRSRSRTPPRPFRLYRDQRDHDPRRDNLRSRTPPRQSQRDPRDQDPCRVWPRSCTPPRRFQREQRGQDLCRGKPRSLASPQPSQHDRSYSPERRSRRYSPEYRSRSCSPERRPLSKTRDCHDSPLRREDQDHATRQAEVAVLTIPAPNLERVVGRENGLQQLAVYQKYVEKINTARAGGCKAPLVSLKECTDMDWVVQALAAGYLNWPNGQTPSFEELTDQDIYNLYVRPQDNKDHVSSDVLSDIVAKVNWPLSAVTHDLEDAAKDFGKNVKRAFHEAGHANFLKVEHFDTSANQQRHNDHASLIDQLSNRILCVKMREIMKQACKKPRVTKEYHTWINLLIQKAKKAKDSRVKNVTEQTHDRGERSYPQDRSHPRDTDVSCRGNEASRKESVAAEVKHAFELKENDLTTQKKYYQKVQRSSQPPLCPVRPQCDNKRHWLVDCPEPLERRLAVWKDKCEGILERRIQQALGRKGKKRGTDDKGDSHIKRARRLTPAAPRPSDSSGVWMGHHMWTRPPGLLRHKQPAQRTTSSVASQERSFHLEKSLKEFSAMPY